MSSSLSIVIPTRDRGSFLVAAVESALVCARADDEIVVVDDGSTDDSLSRLEPHAWRITVIRGAYGSAGAARNAGAAATTGDYLAFLDSDDLMLPGKTSDLVEALDAHPDTALMHGTTEVIDAENLPVPVLTARQLTSFATGAGVGTDYAGLAEYCAMFTSATLLRRSAFEAAGGYDESLEAYEDWDLYLRLSTDWQLRYHDAPAARYRIWPGNVPWHETARWTAAVAERHLAAPPPLSEADARRARYGLLRRLTTSYHVLADRPRTRRSALAAARLDPSRALRDRDVRGPFLRSFAPAKLLKARRPPLDPTV